MQAEIKYRGHEGEREKKKGRLPRAAAAKDSDGCEKYKS
jgi:hypothetical protein